MEKITAIGRGTPAHYSDVLEMQSVFYKGLALPSGYSGTLEAFVRQQYEDYCKRVRDINQTPKTWEAWLSSSSEVWRKVSEMKQVMGAE